MAYHKDPNWPHDNALIAIGFARERGLMHRPQPLPTVLPQPCEDLSGLLFEQRAGRSIVVQGANFEIPTALGIPPRFIVNTDHQSGEDD
jgi:hypothetical protein